MANCVAAGYKLCHGGLSLCGVSEAMRFGKLLFALTMITVSWRDGAAQGTVEGRVVVGDANRPVANVSVHLVNRQMTPPVNTFLTTESDGSYRFTDVKAGYGYGVDVFDLTGRLLASEFPFSVCVGCVHRTTPDLDIQRGVTGDKLAEPRPETPAGLSPALADAFATCLGRDLDERVAACDKLLDPPAVKGAALTAVLAARASGYLWEAKFAEALRDYDRTLSAHPEDVKALRQRGYTYLMMGNPDRALADFGQALKQGTEVAATKRQNALALYASGRYKDASTGMLSEFGRIDAQYEVMMRYLSRTRAGEDAHASLMAEAEKLEETDQWPYPLVEYYLGLRTAAGVLASIAADSNGTKEEELKRRRAEADFFLGEFALTENRVGDAARLLEEAINITNKREVNRVLAEQDMKRIAGMREAVNGARSGGGQRLAAPGRYYALVIGINRYKSPIPQLETARHDAESVAELLGRNYGFEVTTLLDEEATRDNILEAIVGYQAKLKEDDSLLIYYAGHGFAIRNPDKTYDKAYWLPADATSLMSVKRIIADDLTTDIRTLPARHVLIVSDSCFSGGLSRSADDSVPHTDDEQTYLRRMLNGRSRTLMASGGDEPVADAGGDGHSVFAGALLRSLRAPGESVFAARDLFYGSLERGVAGKSDQVPKYAPIRNSGDDQGDFVFFRR